MQENNHQIVLNIDYNDDFYLADSSILPFQFNPNSFMVNSAHNGSLHTLTTTCGLVDILALQHSSRPFPPTYIRGERGLIIFSSLPLSRTLLPGQAYFPTMLNLMAIIVHVLLILIHSLSSQIIPIFLPHCAKEVYNYLILGVFLNIKNFFMIN